MNKKLSAAFVDPKSNHYFLVSDVLAFFTILSIFGLVLETVPALERFSFWFSLVEWVAVAVFSIEYGVRILATKPWYKYSFSFFGLVDLISILPTFFGVGNLTFLKSARIVRLVRFLRLIRLAKLSRLNTGEVEHSSGVIGLNVAIYFVFLLAALITFGTAFYIVETTVEAFVSIPAAMWWSFKVFLGSLPVEAPLSAVGAVLYVMARFVGLILLGVLVGVTGNIFRSLLLTSSSK